MTIHIDWDNPEKTAIRYDFEGQWLRREFEAAFRQSLLMTQSVAHRVDVILDLTTSESLMSNAVEYARNLLPFVPNNRGAIVLVGEQIEVCDIFVRLQRVCKEAGKPLFLAGSLKQARAILPFTHRALLERSPAHT